MARDTTQEGRRAARSPHAAVAPLVAAALLVAAGAPAVAAVEPGAESDLARAVRVARAHAAEHVALPRAPAPTPYAHELPSEALAALAARHGVAPGPGTAGALHALDALDPPARGALAAFVDAFLAMDDAVRAAGPHDAGAVLAARGAFLDATVALETALAASDASSGSSCIAAESYPAYAVSVGSCDDVYEKDVRLLLDTNGNDVYLNNAGGTGRCGYFSGPDAATSALVDLGLGDDAYGNPARPRSCGANGGAIDGYAFFAGAALGLLVDAQGSERYVARDLGVNGGAYAGPPQLHVERWCDAGGICYFGIFPPYVELSVTAAFGLLLDASGSGDRYEDARGWCTDCSVVPKGLVGAQLDLGGSAG